MSLEERSVPAARIFETARVVYISYKEAKCVLQPMLMFATDRLSGAEAADTRENSDQRDRLMNAESPTQMQAGTSLQVWLFENLLRAFATGGATYADVAARLRRLLATGTSPTELLKVVQRNQLIEPLPESAQGVLDLLDDAIRRDAGETVVSAEVRNAETQAAAPREEALKETTSRPHVAHEVRIGPYERAREPESAAAPRASIPAADLAAARVALAAEQRRTRDLELAVAEKNALAEAARAQNAQILSDYNRQKSEMRTLRDSLATRDATLLQVQHSLDERDSRLAALQQKDTEVVSPGEAQVEIGAQLQADLQAAHARADAISVELQAARDAATRLDAQLKRSESRLNSALTELSAARTRSSSYLESIQTHEWRRGFDHNMIRELDAQVGAANAGQQALECEHTRLRSQLAAADSEKARLTAELAARDRTLLQAEERAISEARSAAESREAADLRQTEQAAQLAQVRTEQTEQIAKLRAQQADQIAQLRTEQAEQIARLRTEQAEQVDRAQAQSDRREVEMGVLMAQLQEARHPLQALQDDIKRLTEELAAADSEKARLTAELAARDRMLLQAEERAISEARSLAESPEAADLRQAEQAAQLAQVRTEQTEQIAQLRAQQADQIAQLRTEQAEQIARLRTEQAEQVDRAQAQLDRREVEMGVLMAQLQEARHPLQALQDDIKRLTEELAAADSEKAQLTAELATRDRLLLQAEERAISEARSVAEFREEADLRQAEQAAQLADLRIDADRRQEEMNALVARLQEAGRPARGFEAEGKRLADEPAAKDGVAARLDRQNRKLAATLEWTREALEECESAMRRLESSESDTERALGRIQTSVLERLKSVTTGPAVACVDSDSAAPTAADRWAELVRVDGDRSTKYALARRTRIGRAAACELRIESVSVSRHHALVIVGPRDTVIEDLNSTNGLLVNGKRVTRRVLSDGDALSIGDTRFRYFERLGIRDAHSDAHPST